MHKAYIPYYHYYGFLLNQLLFRRLFWVGVGARFFTGWMPFCDPNSVKVGWGLTTLSAQIGHIMPWTFQICCLVPGTNA